MPNILVTGFEPFGDSDVNPTDIAVKQLHNQIQNGFTIIGKTMPLRYHEIEDILVSWIKEYQPSTLILSGQAGGDQIRLERIAKNFVKTRIPYNCGTEFTGEKLLSSEVDELKGDLPYQEILEILVENKIPVRFSDDAGSFGCNQIFYLARHLYPQLSSGFIHVPLLPEQVIEQNKPSMEQSMITKAIS